MLGIWHSKRTILTDKTSATRIVNNLNTPYQGRREKPLTFVLKRKDRQIVEIGWGFKWQPTLGPIRWTKTPLMENLTRDPIADTDEHKLYMLAIKEGWVMLFCTTHASIVTSAIVTPALPVVNANRANTRWSLLCNDIKSMKTKSSKPEINFEKFNTIRILIAVNAINKHTAVHESSIHNQHKHFLTQND